MSGEKSGKIYLENQNRNSRRVKMPKIKKQTKIDKSAIRISSDRKSARRKRSERRDKIIGNFRGSEDIFWTKVVNGLKKFLEPSFK